MAARITALSADELASLPITKPEAKSLQSKYYFTGKGCPSGHFDKRRTSDGKCCSCVAKYYQDNKDRLDKRHAKWAKSNPEKRKAHKLRCRQKNPDIYKKSALAWKKANQDRVKIYKKTSHKRNYKPKRPPDYKPKNYGLTAAEVTRQWRDTDPNRAKSSRNYSARRHPETAKRLRHIRRGRLKSAEGSFTNHDLKEIMKMQKNKCAHCRAKFVGSCKRTLDHIIAIKNGGSNYRQNLQFLCGPCNSSKGARDPIEFAQSAGRLL